MLSKSRQEENSASFRIGWTTMRKRSDSFSAKNGHNSATTLTTLNVIKPEVTDMWKLETIGISNPTEKKTKDEQVETILKH